MRTQDLERETLLHKLIQRSYRRNIAHSFLLEVCFFGGISLSVVLILSIVNTRLLTTPFLWFCCVVVLGVIIHRWIKRRSTPYQVAQQLDAHLLTNDQISTAHHFADYRGPNDVMVKKQRVLAEKTILERRPARDLPLQIPSKASWLLTLFLLTISAWILNNIFSETVSLETIPQELVDGIPHRSYPQTFVSESKNQNFSNSIKFNNYDQLNDISINYAGDNLLSTGRKTTQSLRSDPNHSQASNGNSFSESNFLSADHTRLNQPQTSTPPPFFNTEQKNPVSNTVGHALSSSVTRSPTPSNLLGRLKEILQSMLSTTDLEATEVTDEKSSAAIPKLLKRHRKTSLEKKAMAESNVLSSMAKNDRQPSMQEMVITSPTALADQSGIELKSTQILTSGRDEGFKNFAAVSERSIEFNHLVEIYQQRTQDISGVFTVESDLSNQKARTPYTAKIARHDAVFGVANRDAIPIQLRHYVMQYFHQLK